ncbi:autotransporter domain-containing protein [Pyxidicoccus parkwayensis]|uniref:Autotransporter domain-containing protein n=1 Tax=Pyxidicoccus parkwayensis TaxID=2813578 RepID=A0ABX7P5G7_9BACT|nr:autotransporter domain-containing protein [Pyxidicoccus parkwaysis]QSQ25701.1 autotransporter domain-containing protein [Pyxidicoccus parkwaysis]
MRSAVIVIGAIVVAHVIGGAPRADAAPQPSGPRPAIGLRAGFGLPRGLLEGGDGHRDAPLSEAVTGIIPAQLDVGYFLGSRFYVGAFFQYALGQRVNGCPEGASCDARAMRFGLEASYHWPVSDRLGPWLGLGVGYDVFDPSRVPSVIDGQLRAVDRTFKGVEVSMQGGLDFRLGEAAWLGPFVALTASRYTNVNEAALHSWLMGGLRLQLRL